MSNVLHVTVSEKSKKKYLSYDFTNQRKIKKDITKLLDDFFESKENVLKSENINVDVLNKENINVDVLKNEDKRNEILYTDNVERNEFIERHLSEHREEKMKKVEKPDLTLPIISKDVISFNELMNNEKTKDKNNNQTQKL